MTGAGASRRAAPHAGSTPIRAKRELAGQVATFEAIAGAARRSDAETDADLADEPDDRTPEDELYDDAPEEAHDGDDDALDDGALDQDATGGVSARPAIAFEPFLRPVPAFARRSRGTYRGGLRARVQLSNTDAEVRGSDGGDANEQGSLERIAAALLALQTDAIDAPSRLEAFFRLKPMQQQQLAERAELDEAAMSRHSNMLIACTWGVCRLQFFTWRATSGPTDNQRRTTELLALVAAVRDHPGEPLLRIGRIAATIADPGASSAAIGKRADALRKEIALVVKLLETPARAALAWSRFPDVSDEQAQAMLGLDGDRGLLLTRMVLAGAFR